MCDGFCTCEDWDYLKKSHPDLLKFDSNDEVSINWIELTEEKGYTQVHRFNVHIKHCLFCGKRVGGV